MLEITTNFCKLHRNQFSSAHMNPLRWLGLWSIAFVALFACSPTVFAQTEPTGESQLLTIEGKVEALRAGAKDWIAAQTNQIPRVNDRVRPAIKSRATIRLSDQSVLRLNQLTTIEIQPVPPGKKAVLDLKAGAAYFYNREGAGQTEFRTPAASGAIRGTEFHLAVAEDGRTVLTLLDGEVDLKNDLGGVDLTSGEQAIVEPGKAPRKTAMVDALNIIQWSLYYPGVIDADELLLSADEQKALGNSLAAYRSGELLKALAEYPANAASLNSPAVKLYVAALDLAVGQVDDAEKILNDFSGGPAPLVRIADSLRQIVATVKFQTWARTAPPQTATEWL